MKIHFNINRFGKLLSKELRERTPFIVKMVGIMSLILVGIWLTSMFFVRGSAVPMEARTTYLYIAVLITALSAPFSMYKNYNHPKKGIDYVTLPASIEEKFLSMLLISTVILPAIAFISIAFTDTFISIISPSMFSGLMITEPDFYTKMNGSVSDLIIIPLLCLLGNLLFRGNKIVKTVLSIIATYIIFIMIIAFIFLYVYKDQIETLQNFELQIRVDNLYDLFRSEYFAPYPGLKISVGILALLYNFGFPIGALTAAYYRMKKLQY
ncbi:MAG: hypothetical protein Q8R90_06210 [Bacteroidales bacterium]|jgi:hypothetical protein|nr:hypothetical protein [Bacteroidales bacterium]